MFPTPQRPRIPGPSRLSSTTTRTDTKEILRRGSTFAAPQSRRAGMIRPTRTRRAGNGPTPLQHEAAGGDSSHAKIKCRLADVYDVACKNSLLTPGNPTASSRSAHSSRCANGGNVTPSTEMWEFIGACSIMPSRTPHARSTACRQPRRRLWASLRT